MAVEKMHAKEQTQEKGKGPGEGKGKNKEKAKGKGKGKRGVARPVVALINAHMSKLLGDVRKTRMDGIKSSGHTIGEGVIRVGVRVPKHEASTWISAGTPSEAILAREVTEFEDIKDLRRSGSHLIQPLLNTRTPMK